MLLQRTILMPVLANGSFLKVRIEPLPGYAEIEQVGMAKVGLAVGDSAVDRNECGDCL